MADTLTSQVAQFVTERVSMARQSTSAAMGHLQAVGAEKVIQNGVRTSIASAIKKLGDLDDQYVTLLRLIHETYGRAEVHPKPTEESTVV